MYSHEGDVCYCIEPGVPQSIGILIQNEMKTIGIITVRLQQNNNSR